MTKEKIYVYLGTNGIIESPVYLEGIYSVKKYRLFSANGMVLTKDGKNLFQNVTIPESEVDDWYEIVGQI